MHQLFHYVVKCHLTPSLRVSIVTGLHIYVAQLIVTVMQLRSVKTVQEHVVLFTNGMMLLHSYKLSVNFTYINSSRTQYI